MSKIGKKNITIPDGVSVHVGDDAITVKGPGGELFVAMHEDIGAVLEDGVLRFEPKREKLDKFGRSMWGTIASLTINAIEGVTKGFEKKLEINGVGYRAAMEGNALVLNVGFSHTVRYEPPESIVVTAEKNSILIKGIDKALVGEVAAKIRAFKKPEPYKGKGIKYHDEVIRRKAGKKVVGAGA